MLKIRREHDIQTRAALKLTRKVAQLQQELIGLKRKRSVANTTKVSTADAAKPHAVNDATAASYKPKRGKFGER